MQWVGWVLEPMCGDVQQRARLSCQTPALHCLPPVLQPVIVPFTSSTSNSGLEHFTVRFKWDTYDVSALPDGWPVLCCAVLCCRAAVTMSGAQPAPPHAHACEPSR